MKQKMLMLFLMVSTALLGSAELGATCPPAMEDEPKASDKPKISETDTYLDLKTGKTFRIIYDALNEKYNREDLFEFEFFVNTRTRDTFWLEDALLVNNALLRDAAGNYKVNPMKVKRDGSGYKVINNKAIIRENGKEKGVNEKEGAGSM